MNPMSGDGDEDIADEELLQESCARTDVYVPKRARYFTVYFNKHHIGLMSRLSWRVEQSLKDHGFCIRSYKHFMDCDNGL